MCSCYFFKKHVFKIFSLVNTLGLWENIFRRSFPRFVNFKINQSSQEKNIPPFIKSQGRGFKPLEMIQSNVPSITTVRLTQTSILETIANIVKL